MLGGCCTTDANGQTVSTDQLLKIAVPPPSISPVGITPAVTQNGRVSTPVQGKGDGIFNTVLNVAKMVYSTAKPPAGTSGASTPIANTVGTFVGTGIYSTTAEEGKTNGSNNLVWFAIALLVAKLLKLF